MAQEPNGAMFVEQFTDGGFKLQCRVGKLFFSLFLI